MVALEQVGHAAFARLAVHPDDRVVGAAEVGGVDRQVGHIPEAAFGLALGQALLDGVLVRARERGEHKFAAVGMTRVHRQLGAVLGHPDGLVDVREVDAGVDALGVEVHGQRHQADIAGALAVAEQAALDAVGSRHVAEFRRRDRGAAVVVRVQGEHD